MNKFKKITAITAAAAILATAAPLTDILPDVMSVTASANYEYDENGLCIENGELVSVSQDVTSVVIPNSVTKIGNDAFYCCTNLTSVTIPNSVTEIGRSAFSNCKSLTSVTIPNSVTKIGDWAFLWCKSLIEINVAEDNPNLCSVDGILYNKNKTELIECPEGKSGKITIPNSVTTIGDYAFWYCYSLTSITIPNSVTAIGDGAFVVCPKLKNIDVAEDNPNFCSVDGILYNENKTELIWCPNGKSGKITIPNSVTKIGRQAFKDCTSLTSITIPDSVTSIGSSAFYGCTSLTSVTIPGSVTEISKYAFNDCTNLTEVIIRDGVTIVDGDIRYIGIEGIVEGLINSSGAFADCTSLKSIVIPKSVTKISDGTFIRCDNLKDVYYAGSKWEWENIEIGDVNDNLLNANIHFNSTGPSDTPVTPDPVTPDPVTPNPQKVVYNAATDILGDVDGDGRINTTDATAILMYNLGLATFEGNSEKNSDVNGDGKINAIDATQILKQVLGLA